MQSNTKVNECFGGGMQGEADVVSGFRIGRGWLWKEGSTLVEVK